MLHSVRIKIKIAVVDIKLQFYNLVSIGVHLGLHRPSGGLRLVDMIAIEHRTEHF
jgi:hypothetical protein